MAETVRDLWNSERKRESAFRFYCPRCRAEPGAPCRGKKNQVRKAVHISRYNKARQVATTGRL